MFNSRPYAATPVVGSLSPVTVKNSETFTTVVDMSAHLAVEAVLMLGDMPNEGITFRCVACDSDGNNPTATLTGKTLTITASATTNDSTQHVIQLTSGDLAATQPTKRYVKFGVVTDNTVGGPMGVAVLSVPPRYGAGASADAATVKNVV